MVMDFIIFCLSVGFLFACVVGAVFAALNFIAAMNIARFYFNTIFRRRRIVDDFFINVHSTNNMLKYIKLERVHLGPNVTHSLYPVFYFDDGIYAPYSKHYGNGGVNKSIAVGYITDLIQVDESDLLFADDGRHIRITIKNGLVSTDKLGHHDSTTEWSELQWNKRR